MSFEVHSAEASPSSVLENPFAEPASQNRSFNILTTSCILLEQLQTLEQLCDTTQSRVEHKREVVQALESEARTLGIDVTREASDSSVRKEGGGASLKVIDDTPGSRRVRLPSPRLRGLYDVHGPGRLNFDGIQTSADFSPRSAFSDDSCEGVDDDATTQDGWVDEDEDEEAPFIDHHGEVDVHTIRVIPLPRERSSACAATEEAPFSGFSNPASLVESHPIGDVRACAARRPSNLHRT
ncbi:hypothetical protein BV22DRAFT_1034524 [Leucogyrophana mollusca]|uniref:Uncharacterized protein n=1 Tax=Leucogyrophana mollusca TaxID=85980 RepID=A0ACB8BGM3_9AGAM|nr:hypothetical protein BV22DRAFT_1034524 [Leucogyrophana mollusca]